MSSKSEHITVLLNEAVSYLQVKYDKWYVDATFGGGGHTKKILDQGGLVFAIDQDEKAVERGKVNFQSQIAAKKLILVKGSFTQIDDLLNHHQIQTIDGALFDLGISSDQLIDPTRGFSFLREGPLDMRMDQTLSVSAADLVNALSKNELTKIFRIYGEVPKAGLVADVIIKARKKQRIASTLQLAEIIKNAYRGFYGKKIHPATLVFQALRIAVNNELEILEETLKKTVERLDSKGRIAVISFHSLEDRIVKNFFRSAGDLNVLTKKPVLPSQDEVVSNPSARSAKLRVAEKTN